MLDRKTTISSQVLRQLEKASSPLSVAQIMERLMHQGLSPNKTTIYRILEKLKLKKVVDEIPVRSGVSYYEFSQEHHHHFICNVCDTVFCLQSCHVHLHGIVLENLLPNSHFTIQSHDFNLYGVCESCSD